MDQRATEPPEEVPSRVAEATRVLAEVTELPVGERAEHYERVHRLLQDALSMLDTATPQ